MSAVGIQFRVKEDTYENVTRLKIEWVDEYDAMPGSGGGVIKATPDELKAMNAKFKKFMKPKKVTPATAKPKNTPATPKKQSTKWKPKPVAPVPPSSPAEETPLPKSAIPEGKCTQTEAFDEAYASKRGDITDEDFNKAWFEAILSVTGTTTYDGIIGEQWFHIKNELIEKTGIPF